MARLTEEQQRAVRHGEGCACVIAGAGTGKTRALSERLRCLVEERGLRPERVLATTFTRKATAELYRKAYEELGRPAQQLKITTIDALTGELADVMVGRGLLPPVRVTEDDEQRLLRWRAAWDVFGRGRMSSRRAWAEAARRTGLMGLLDGCLQAALADEPDKESLVQAVRLRLETLRAAPRPADDFALPSIEELPRFLRRFRELSDEQATVGHDVLARKLLACLKRHEEIAAELASHFDAILVDEFQDTSRVQAEILLLLSGKQGHLWVVGDPCQQIYAWRGAWRENFQWLMERTAAAVYRLTENFRSRQPILDAAYQWLGSQAAPLAENGMLTRLVSSRERAGELGFPYPVFTGTREQAFDFLRQLLATRRTLRPSDIAILCRSLTPGMAGRLEAAARARGLLLQYHTSRADRALAATIGDLPPSGPGRALPDLYAHPVIDRLISKALDTTDFTALRALRPLAAAVDAYDGAVPPGGFTIREAWPALEKTTDREVAVTPAVVSQPDAIQVMTIHAAKGLDFPVVVVMELRGGSRTPFPDPGNPEEAQLLYVAATRARDLLVLAHSASRPHHVLAAFGHGVGRLPWNGDGLFVPEIEVPDVTSPPPVIKATDLGLYEQCRLRFAAIHEGRYLPPWMISQSLGARAHKAWELWARAGMPDDEPSVERCLAQGIRVGDSPQRKLPAAVRNDLERAYREMLAFSRSSWIKALAVEQRYTYVHGSAGQVEGVVDAVMEARDGAIVLVEWKTTREVAASRKRPCELQARAGALGLLAQGAYAIERIEIIPSLDPANAQSIRCDERFTIESRAMFDEMFRMLQLRNYPSEPGEHCKQCPLKKQCPEWQH